MSDVQVDTGGPTLWTIVNGGAGGVIDPYRQSVAAGAQLTVWYGARLKQMALDIQEDTQALATLTAAVKKAGTIDFTAAPIASWPTTADDQLARTRELNTLLGLQSNVQVGASLGELGNMARVTVQESVFNTIPYFDLPYPPIESNMSAAQVEALQRYSPPMEPGFYKTTDGQLFIVIPAFGTQVLFKPSELSIQEIAPFLTKQPVEEDRPDWVEFLTKKAEEKTQVSQQKQLFLQDLTQGMNKFLNWVTSLIQREERVKSDIVGRF